MKHPPHLVRKWVQQRQRIFTRIALMDDTVQAALGGNFKVLLKQGCLFLFVSEIGGCKRLLILARRICLIALLALLRKAWESMVIQTCLAQGDDFGMPRKFPQGRANVL